MGGWVGEGRRGGCEDRDGGWGHCWMACAQWKTATASTCVRLDSNERTAPTLRIWPTACACDHARQQRGQLVTGRAALPARRRCAVQRIAKRSRVLADDRAELLDSLGFDWSGADALS